MKILYIITSLSTGGAEHLVVDLLPRLRDLGNEVELLIFDGTKTPFYEQLETTCIKIHSLGVGGNVYNPLNIFKLVKFIRKYDVIHTHNTACQLFVPVAKCLTFGGAKLVTTEHNTTNRRRGIGVFRFVDRLMYSFYKRIICISDKTQEYLEHQIGEKRKIITINNGIDTATYFSCNNEIKNKREYTITMVGAFREQKDQDTLLRAVHKLPEQYNLLIVGDGSRRSILMELASSLNILSRVKFWGVRSDIPAILEKSDIVVLSSHWEGFGLAAVEGMAAARPVIASDVPGVAEVVSGAGVLFPHGDHVALADAIKHLCENPEEYKAVAARCQERAKQYDISVMAEKYNEVYKEF